MSRAIQILILVFILFYLFYGIDISKIDFTIFSGLGLFLTFISLLISQLILSIRWMKMSSLSFVVSFETISISSALNMILPARLGEVSKALYLKNFYNYNYNKSISIIFMERFFDVIVLFLLMCLWAYNYFSNTLLNVSILILATVIFVIILFFNSKKILKLIKKIPLKYIRVYAQKIYKNINRLLKNPYSILGYTLILWFLYLLSYVLFFMFSVDFHLTLKDILELFIFSTIALSIPLTPAGIGTFESAVVLFLSHHGIDKTDALISATVYHILIFAVDFILLYFVLFIKKLKLKDVIKR